MDLWNAARDRAKELVHLDLDAMAEEDDYIHSETLNVSKTATTRPPQADQQQDQQQSFPSASNFFIRQDSASSQQSNGYPVAPAPSSASWSPNTNAGAAATAALQHMASSSSSWSLLDRKPASRTTSSTNVHNASSGSLRVEEATARLNAMVFDGVSNNNGNAKMTMATTTSNHSSQHRTRSASEASQTLSISDEGDDDDASQDSYDADDPILSLIHQQQSSRGGSGTNGTTKNRFMNELDERLAQPSVPEKNQPNSTSSNPLEIDGNSSNHSNKVMPPPRKLWPWQNPKQTAATTSNPNNVQDEEEGAGRPLWARPKKKKTKPTAEEESFVLVSSGNLGFSEEEKQALANLQQSATKDTSGGSGNILSDHPRESFVALTLVLGGAVYWFARTSAADDIAL